LGFAWVGPARLDPASRTTKQRAKPTCTVEGRKIVEASNVRSANVDLGNGSAPGALHHFESAIRLKINTHLLDAVHAARSEELFGALTIWANCRGVHKDWRHRRRSAWFKSGYVL
jgi:hypothetical protein